MKITWEGGRPLADRRVIAALYGVSEMTVRRWCTKVRQEPRRGQARGAGVALYDAFAAADDLAHVLPRPERTSAAVRYRLTVAQQGRAS